MLVMAKELFLFVWETGLDQQFLNSFYNQHDCSKRNDNRNEAFKKLLVSLCLFVEQTDCFYIKVDAKFYLQEPTCQLISQYESSQ